MKIKYLSFVFFLFSLFYFCQEKVDIGIAYTLTYKIDSTSQNFKTENFLLYANKERSKFLSAVTYTKDSLSQNSNNKKDLALRYRTPNDYYIIIEPQTNTISQFQNLVNANVYYSSNENIKWHIEKETKQIMNLKCRKATIELFGRNWVAWFSEEYAFPFGPYKFYNLPGLIIEVYDSRNDYHFVATQIKQKKDKLVDFDLRKKYLETPKDTFWKLNKQNKNEVSPIFNDLRFEDPTVLPKMKKNLEERQKRENNPLELKH